MPRKPYRITTEDYHAAKCYLDKKVLMEQGMWLLGCRQDDVRARSDYPPLQARSPHSSEERLVMLNQWCERYLSERQWTQLKNAIRSARRKNKPERLRAGATFTIKLTYDAYTYVKTLAANEELTISEFLEKRLECEWQEVFDEDL